MPGRYAERMIRSLGGAAPDAGPGADADLLRAFAATRDPAAFESLVRRYGPLVMGVCRRVLGRAPEADDAFQATFLVLARKAGAVAGNLGGWLHTTAHRTALRARHANAKRAAREQHMDPMPSVAVAHEVADQDEILAALDREIRRLPAKLRAPVVLCELQGRPRAEVARELGVPEGTLSSRLGTARKLLAKRLARHHPALTAGGLALLFANAALARPHPDLVAHTVATAGPFAAGSLAGPLVTPAVRSLAEGVLSHMFAAKLTSAIVLAAFLAGAGGVRLSADTGTTPDTAPAPRTVALVASATPQEKKADPKTEPPKKDEAKKDEPKKDDSTAAIKTRLKKYEDEIGRIRESMLKDVDVEQKRLEEDVKKAEKTREDAMKVKDFDAANKAFQAISAARGELMKLQQVRNDITTRHRPAEAAAPPPPADERLGLKLSVPDKVVVSQLGLEKNQGLVIDSVKANTPAAKLGLLAADILVKIDGTPVPNSTAAFRKLLTDLKPDATFEVVVLRKGKPETVKGLTVPPVPAAKTE